MTNRKKHLPALKKAFGASVFFALFFLAFFGLLPQRNTVFAQPSWCVSYATCHFYNGPGAAVCTDQPWLSPFRRCICIKFADGSFKKEEGYFCGLQEGCNFYMDSWRNPADPQNCPEYSDICGCSGVPTKLLPTPTLSPIPTPTPPRASCYQPCWSNVDCQSPLVCGYHLKAGQRVCHNPACAGETDCTCSWQSGSIQAAFSRLKALSQKKVTTVTSSLNQSLSSGLERAWKRLKALQRI